MNRRLIGVIAGVSVLGLGVPAFAAARGGDGTPEDNNVPGDVRGNCDEAEHANDPECLAVTSHYKETKCFTKYERTFMKPVLSEPRPARHL